MSNFTASFLHFMKREILDEQGNPVSTIFYEDEVYPLKYSKPSIVYNYLEVETDKNAVLKQLTNSKQIEALGFSVCTILPPKEWGWKTNSKAFILLKNGTIDERYAKKTTDIRGHYALLDEANLRIKLCGRKCSPQGEGPWIEL
jgi:hypothetical protein